MNKKFWMSFVGAFVVMFVLSFIFHVVVASGYIEKTFENVTKPGGFIMWGIILTYLILALVMSWIYPKGYAGGSPVAEGVRFGLVIGILVQITAAFEQFATMDIALVSILGDRLWHLVEIIAGGIVIGIIYGKTENSA